MKKAAVFNDLSGFGKCSLTAAIPVLSAQGVQGCPMASAVLTNQTGYELSLIHIQMCIRDRFKLQYIFYQLYDRIVFIQIPKHHGIIYICCHCLSYFRCANNDVRARSSHTMTIPLIKPTAKPAIRFTVPITGTLSIFLMM